MREYSASISNGLFVLIMVVLFIVMLLKKHPIRKIIALELFLGTLMILIAKSLFPLYTMPQHGFLQDFVKSFIPFKNLDATINGITFASGDDMNKDLYRTLLNSIILYFASSVLISGAFRLFPLKNITSFLIGIFVPSLVLGVNIYLYLNCLTSGYNFFDTSAFIFIIIGSAIGTFCAATISKAITKKKEKLEEQGC